MGALELMGAPTLYITPENQFQIFVPEKSNFFWSAQTAHL